MHSKRLRPSDWHILNEVKDREGFLQYLSTTSYGPWVGQIVAHREQNEELFETRIYSALFDDYRKILKSLTNAPSRELVLGLFSRFEAENLKVTLRAIFSGLKRIHVSHLLYPLGRMSRLPWEGLWRQKDIKDAVRLLANTRFGPMLNHALPQFEAQGRLFPLEMAIDISCFRRISDAIEALSDRLDRTRVKEVVGSYIDVLNICHIARLRFIYGLSPEEALNYSYPGGKELNLKTLHALARAEDLPSLAKILEEPFKGLIQGSQSNLFQMRRNLEGWLIRRIRRAFLGSPFHLGVQVAHLLEKEMEIKSIISLYQAKVQSPQKPAEEIVPGILLKGGDQVVQAS